MIAWIVLLFSLFFFGEAKSATYYVATTGSDSNTAVQAQVITTPWLTIQKCLDNVSAGDTCEVAAGTYAANTVVGWIKGANGTQSQPITIHSTTQYGAAITMPGNRTIGQGSCYGFLIGRAWYVIDGFDISGGTCYDGNSALHSDGGTNLTLKNNKVHGIGQGVCSDSSAGFDGIFLDTNASNTTIDSNIIYGIGRLNPGENGCSATQQATGDHGIYNKSPGFLTITRNLFYQDFRGWPIHLSPSSITVTNLKINNNTFADQSSVTPANRPTGHIIFNQNITTGEVKNNISYEPYLGMLYVSCVCTFSNVVVDYNHVYHATQSVGINTGVNTGVAGISYTTGGVSHNSIDVADPMFTNVAARDYTLLAGSPAIDSGTNVGLSYQGSAPDKGAFEVTADTTPPLAPTGLIISQAD